MKPRRSHALERLLPSCLLTLLAIAACKPDPPPSLPPGLVIVAEPAALDRFVARATSTGPHTRLATAAAVAQTVACDKHVILASDTGEIDDALTRARCETSADAKLIALRKRSIVASVDGGARIVHADVSQDGSLVLTFTVDGKPAPLDGVLARGDIAHAAWRYGSIRSSTLSALGLDPSPALVTALAAGLDGTLEAAVYTPAAGRRSLPLAVALGTTSDAAARAALDAMLADLSARYGLGSRDLDVAGARARCVTGLKVLTDLSPCALIVDGAVIIGWHPDDVVRARAGTKSAFDTSFIDVNFVAASAADDVLTRTWFGSSGVAPPNAFSRLRAEHGPDGVVVRLE